MLRLSAIVPRAFLVLFALAVLPAAAEIKPFETKARQAYMIEAETGTVLFAKNEDELIPPASLAKLMTAEYVFNEIRSGRLSMDTEFPVSEYAWRTGGALSKTSTMFAALNSRIRVEDLLKGMIIQSANDGAIVLAEGLAGSEAAFAAKLTERARALGMTKSVFGNSNGLPDEKSRVTMRELVLLARHIQVTYPQQFAYYSQEDFEWNKIRQRNRNPLLALNIGVDGMKTGYTEASGYAIVATINRGGTRLFLAMSGLATPKERAEESQRMLEWGLSSFERKVIFKPGEIIAEASVYGGLQSSVPLVAKSEVDVFIPANNDERIRGSVSYGWPLKAPVARDQPIGTLNLFLGERPLRSVPLYSAGSTEAGSLSARAFDGLKELLFFWL